MAKVVLSVLFVARTALAQQNSGSRVTVLAVCEVLGGVGGVNRFADTAVAVVGRMERSVGASSITTSSCRRIGVSIQ